MYHGEKPNGAGVSRRLHVLIAHEAVHCYQYALAIALGAHLEPAPFPEWVSEGSATYLATLYAGYAEDQTESDWRVGWLGRPNNNLTTRTYDAVGWYALVAKESGSLWPKMVAAWTAYLQGGTNAYISALGGDTPAVASAWAPSLLNTPAWGDAWTTPGIEVPVGAQPTTVSLLRPGDASNGIKIDPLAAVVDEEKIDADDPDASGLIEISVTDGDASVHDAKEDYVGFTDEVFCLKTSCGDSAVSCSGAKVPLKLAPLTSPFVVAAGGGTSEATYEIAKIPAPPSPSTPETVPKNAGPCNPQAPGAARKPGFSQGDPHLQALNGGTYDFQGAGEYTLVRNDSGDVDVQIRATPWSVPGSVASNTAVAMRLGTTKVEVDAGSPVKVLIGGTALPANRLTNENALDKLANEKLRGGGHLAFNGPSTVASWPDGSSLNVYADKLGENVIFTPPSPGVDTFSGLLTAWVAPKGGTSAPNQNSETLLGGDGHRYVLDPTTRVGFATLYGAFAKSWRITAKTSLFTYPKGKSTSSYVVKGFPLTNAALVDLLTARKTSAAATCKADGVTDPKLLDDCVLDVAETGQTDLATAFSRTLRGEVSAAQPAPGNASVHPVAYYFTHPCQVITPADIKQALGQAYPDNVIPPGSCVIDTVPEDGVQFVHESLDQFKAGNPGSVGSGPVSSLGHDAYCVVRPILTPDQSDVVLSIGSAGIVSVLADNCADATELAVDALAHVSGL